MIFNNIRSENVVELVKNFTALLIDMMGRLENVAQLVFEKVIYNNRLSYRFRRTTLTLFLTNKIERQFADFF